jgi:hypothetical protein
VCVHVTPSNLVLRFVVACLPAVNTVILAVLGEAKREIRLAQGAILYAGAAFLGLVANCAKKFFLGHCQRLTFRIELVPAYFAAKRRQNQTVAAAKPQRGVCGERVSPESALLSVGFSVRDEPAVNQKQIRRG